MSALSGTSSLHRDIRSEKRSYKRDKEHNVKWALGERPSAGVKIFQMEAMTGSKEQQIKIRPNKCSSSPDKSQGNSFSLWQAGSAASRVSRKQDALKEASSAPLSKSLSEHLPSSVAGRKVRTPSIDAGVLYSFDAVATPRKAVVLGSLVEKAEREWNIRETDKIVRNEYEILDSSGEVTWVSKGKGRKGSPRQHTKVVMAQDDDEDWETI